MSRNYEPAMRFLRIHEGLRLHSYRDAIGVWTIGYGETEHVGPGQVISFDQAERLLEAGVENVGKKIEAVVTTGLTDNQLCALISFVYNVGLSAFYHSTLLHKLNGGWERGEVANEFLKWVHAGGKRLAGLITRREAERALFLTV